MIYAGYVKVAPGKPQTGRVKLKISPGTREAKFHWLKAKIPLGLLQRSVRLVVEQLATDNGSHLFTEVKPI